MTGAPGLTAHLGIATPEALLQDAAEMEGLNPTGQVWHNAGGNLWQLRDPATEPSRPAPHASAQVHLTLEKGEKFPQTNSLLARARTSATVC